jgi:Subtilase family
VKCLPPLRSLPLLLAAWLMWMTGGAQGQPLRPPPASQILADAGEVVDARQIVVLARTAADADLLLSRALPKAYRLQKREPLPALGLHLLVLRLPHGTTGPAAIRELEAMVPGVTAGVNHAYKSAPVSSTPVGRSYANAMMGWPAQGCAAVLDIGVIDAAIGDDRMVNGGPLVKAVVAKDFTGGHPAPTSHARMVASLMTGPGRLVGARLFSAGVVARHADQEAAAGADAMVSALEWLAGSGVRLVNISLAGPYNKLLDLAVQSATARGMVLVAATGNNGPGSPPRYPAAFEDVLAVTAVDAAGRVFAQAVRGWHVDYAAPGVDLLVEERGALRYASGTSLATPLVTARLAADAGIRQAHSLEKVRALLDRSFKDLGAAGRDPVFGVGLVLLNGVCGAAHHTPTRVSPSPRSGLAAGQ